MITNKQLADYIFPEVKETLEDLEKRYPLRNLPEGAEVTRFAPSPTGFLHTGSLFMSMICHKIAKQTNGVFYIRLEDTDTKREIEGSGEELLKQLKAFNIIPDEGYLGDHEEGNYGPYVQSRRADIYRVVIKYLLEQGLAYPCFCSPEDLAEIRKAQEAIKENPGYYGKYARCRDLSNEERMERIKNGEPFVIRFRSSGDHNNKIMVSDMVHGDFEIAQNDQDIVIYKSDKLPTYHFAHVVDDHFMRTTTVIRGGEWIASLPIHVELFETLKWKAPKYAHMPVIMKVDENGNKRKLSKRKDTEAAVSYFVEEGYPAEGLIIYLMTLANSNFEQYILDNKLEGMDNFKLAFDKFAIDGSLFDMGKVNFFSKEFLGKLNKHEITLRAKEYAKKYNPKLYDLISRDEKYFEEIMNIEREKENPRKDYEKFSIMPEVIGFFYDDIYEELIKQPLPFNEKFSKEVIASTLSAMRDGLSLDQDEQSWFNNMKEVAIKEGFAANNKEFKANPEAFKGTVGDVAELLRITFTARKNAPNLYYVMKILGKEKCEKRINTIISLLNK